MPPCVLSRVKIERTRTRKNLLENDIVADFHNKQRGNDCNACLTVFFGTDERKTD